MSGGQVWNSNVRTYEGSVMSSSESHESASGSLEGCSCGCLSGLMKRFESLKKKRVGTETSAQPTSTTTPLTTTSSQVDGPGSSNSQQKSNETAAEGKSKKCNDKTTAESTETGRPQPERSMRPDTSRPETGGSIRIPARYGNNLAPQDIPNIMLPPIDLGEYPFSPNTSPVPKSARFEEDPVDQVRIRTPSSVSTLRPLSAPKSQGNARQRRIMEELAPGVSRDTIFDRKTTTATDGQGPKEPIIGCKTTTTATGATGEDVAGGEEQEAMGKSKMPVSSSTEGGVPLPETAKETGE